MLKKTLLIIISFITCYFAKAQVPYFGKTPGDKSLYGYTSVKFRPGINNIESYNTFQFGVTDYAAGGIDFYTGSGSASMGIMLRAGYSVNQWFSIGGTATPSFNLNDNFKFSYFTGGLFMNGGITRDARLFWCINTWFGINRGAKDTINQFTYLGYEFRLKNKDAITPMLGLEHSWLFNRDPDIAAGFYYTHKQWNFYLWGNDFCKVHPRVVVGVDFKFK